jgi:hypothetical protein
MHDRVQYTWRISGGVAPAGKPTEVLTILQTWTKMKKKRIISEHVEEPPPNTFSLCQVVGSQVFMSGMCSPGNDVYEQSQQILKKHTALNGSCRRLNVGCGEDYCVSRRHQ